MFDPQQHPRDNRGRFARKGVSLVKRSVAAEDKRDEVSARIPEGVGEFPTMDDFMAAMLAAFPAATVEEDNDGQLIIYTGLRVQDSRIVSFDPDNS